MNERPFHARDDLPTCAGKVTDLRGKLRPCQRAPDPGCYGLCSDCAAGSASGVLRGNEDEAEERQAIIEEGRGR